MAQSQPRSTLQPADAPPEAPARGTNRPTVRALVHTRGGASSVRVEQRGADGEYQVICESQRTEALPPPGVSGPYTAPWLPCTVDVPAGTELRVLTGGGTLHKVLVAGEPGGEVDLEVATPKRRAAVRRSNVGFAGRAQGGIGLRRFYGDSIVAGEATFGVGIYVDNVDFYVDFHVLSGTVEGLGVRQYRGGATFDAELFDRARVGGGLALGGTGVDRAVSSNTMHAFTVGMRIFVSFDVVRLGEHPAIYVLGQLSVDTATGFATRDERPVQATTLWGPTLAVGARF